MQKKGSLEEQRLYSLTAIEREEAQKGYLQIAGLDEAGRGPLAGPVVAAACVIAPGELIRGVDDSKKLSSKQRAEVFQRIISHPNVLFAVGVVEPHVIDRINIFQATICAMLEAVELLRSTPDLLLVDGLHLPHPTIRCRKIIQGDRLSQSIAAASIIAKQTRDRIMCSYHEKYPHYGFDRHKGYGTVVHKKALQTYGPCAIHRRSFSPVKVMVDTTDQTKT